MSDYGWTGRTYGALHGKIVKDGTEIDTDKEGNARGEVDVLRSIPSYFEPEQEHSQALNDEQREIIVGTLAEFKRSPKLRDPAVQAQILRRIEGALTRLAIEYRGPNPARSVERLERLATARGDEETKRHLAALHEPERDLIDLLASNGLPLTQNAQTAADSLKLGRGQKFGRKDENATRFLADQLADLFEVGLGIRAGHGDKSAFRALLDVVCGQTGLKVLSRDAVQSITIKYIENNKL